MIQVGDKYEHEYSFTQKDVELFAQVTGDNNPIHIDEEFAKTTPFGRPIMHGYLSTAVFSKVFGTLFPGNGTIYMYQEIKFKAPMWVDTKYTAIFEVESIDREKHSGYIDCKILDQEGKECVVGRALLKHFTQF